VIVSYSFLYTALVGLVLRVGGLVRHRSSIATAVLAVLAGGLLQILLFADRTVYEMYGFHANGFVLNLVHDQGGVESMGHLALDLRRDRAGSRGIDRAPGRALSGGIATRRDARRPSARAGTRGGSLAAAAAITALFLVQSLGFAYAQYARLAPIESSARLVPFYLPLEHAAGLREPRHGARPGRAPSSGSATSRSRSLPARAAAPICFRAELQHRLARLRIAARRCARPGRDAGARSLRFAADAVP
jgi:hypothetical protein